MRYFQLLFYLCALAMWMDPVCRAQEEKGPLMSAERQYQNRLAHQKSPYLLQHADNPVDWYPWGDEAFEKARKEDQPVFLSIGYSTCHWCHVMEHESFEDVEIAALINKNFIAIKVDREERPDIDNIYMKAVMTMTGSGGWPLTVFLTPDRQPFFGGTYFPPRAKWGSPGLTDLIGSLHEAWVNRRSDVIESAGSLTQLLKDESPQERGEGDLTPKTLEKAYDEFVNQYDSQYGGFGMSPKFPTAHNISFLMRYWKRSGDQRALEMAENTLKKMTQGGVYDHLGGGFHRYATDRQWQIPHFEKMLYDQAILARAYLEAYQITKNEIYAQVAREILDYVLRDMQQAQGGFYSAEDADSLDPGSEAGSVPANVKKEGAFYLWRYDEIKGVLGRDEAAIFGYHFGIEPQGNAHNDPHGELAGRNIIFVNKTVDETAAHFKRSVTDIQAILKRSKERLFEARGHRPRPHLDDKVLVDWNGLMISSLAFGARVFDELRYSQAAEMSARFILERMVGSKGRLLHRYRAEDAAILGSIEDYAFFINGLLDLYEATFKAEYLKRGIDLAETMVDLFWDKKEGGFYFTGDDAEKLLFREKEIYDGAVPSGNSVAALVLVRLSHITLQERWGEKLTALFKVFGAQISLRPSSYAQMLAAYDFAVGPSMEIVIAGAPQSDSKGMVHAVYRRFIPNKVVLFRPGYGEDDGRVVRIAPFIEAQLPIGNEATVYICENHVCKLPVREIDKLEALLDSVHLKR